MSTEEDQRTDTLSLVRRLRVVDLKLARAYRNVAVLQHLHDEIAGELHRRAERAATLHGVARSTGRRSLHL